MIPNSNEQSLLSANSTKLNLHLDDSIKFKFRSAIGVQSIQESNDNEDNPSVQN